MRILRRDEGKAPKSEGVCTDTAGCSWDRDQLGNVSRELPSRV